MDRGGIFQPTMASTWSAALISRARGRAGFQWFYLPCLIGALGVGAVSTVYPLQALLVLFVMLVVVAVWRWPVLAAYLVVGLTPLTTGIKPFMDLAGQVMTRPEYKDAPRVFVIVGAP